MEPSFQFDALGEDGFQVLLEDSERVLCRGWRLGRNGSRSPILVVLPAVERPSPLSLERLAHEYGLKDELDGVWALRPLELESDRARTKLVFEDPGGEPLVLLLGAPMEMGSFLRLAIGTAAAVSKMHQHGLVHKDIKPANILVNCADGRVRLTGFGLASRLPRERQAPEPPEIIAGTLAYMAPEQTGRMNRSIDSRSDLYALGVTFYEMLTGALPFNASDPIEWVHCHVARRPVAPAERLNDIPNATSAIIMKLLAKTAEERYQTAGGLESDLRRCLAEWKALDLIGDFPLGQQDTPNRLLIPEKLYGRARDIETLRAAFDRVIQSGTPELVLVSGYSGIGKSSVVNELHKVLVPARALFAAGKFDQYKRDIPYSTLVQAFRSLVRPLLGKSDIELNGWRDTLLEALGPNGRLMIDLVPELKLIIGEQPALPDLPPQDAQRRFQLVFRRLIGVFARPEHPLALFLDDLQWVDTATLDLMEHLFIQPDVRHLMLIGAYRDNEVDPAHPLMRKLVAIRNAGVLVREIKLGPLSHEDVGQLIADTVRCERARAAPLTQLAHEKTAANPFFLIQFLQVLAERGLLTFEHDQARWSWDLDRIHAKGYTDNVVDLMVTRLTRLPAETRTALQELACLGNVAAITMLSTVLGVSEEQIHTNLWEAVRQELVERREGSYRFIHDRVQESAYALIPEALQAETHLRIGRLLAAHTPPEKREEAIFEIVNQLNRATALITLRDEREQLAGFNLIAGKRAKASSAYASALSYLATAGLVLAEDRWERCYRLVFAIELDRAECEFLTGDLAAANERLLTLSQRAANIVDKSAATCLRIVLNLTLDRQEHAVEIGLEYLRGVGIAWPPHPTEAEAWQEYERMREQLGGRPIEALFDLPLISDPAWRGTMEVLMNLCTPAFFNDKNLWVLVLLRMASLSIEHGNSDASCFAYAYLVMIVGSRFGDYRTAYRFTQLSFDLMEKKGLDRFRTRVYGAGNFCVPWTRHLREARPLLRRALVTGPESGDVTFTAYTYNNLVANLLGCGEPLEEAQREAENGLRFAQKARFGMSVDIMATQLGLVKTLRGLTPSFGSFHDEEFDEYSFEQHLESQPYHLPGCWYWIRKLQARLYAGDYRKAVAAAAKARPLLWTTTSLFEEAEYHFYGALARAIASDSATPDERRELLEVLAEHHERLAFWAENCLENFEHRAALVGAEIARVEGRELDAEHLYERAIRSARAHGFVHNEALAYEVAARFYAARGFTQIADLYLRNARYGYLRWGADGKVRQLDEMHPHLRANELVPGPTNTMGAPIEHLDLATVIKVSQAVSGEIVLEKLLDTIIRTAMVQAGAERALIILARDVAQRIAAEATTSGDSVAVHLRDEAAGEAALPESILHYVLRTREIVILDDASAHSPFSADPYIRQRRARSVLCVPLLTQAKLIGALYLENNLAPRVFAPARISVLKLLASQAAISLENTSLYRDLAEREAKIRHLVDANIIGIFIWNVEGQVIEANDAFLHMVGYDREDLTSGRVNQTDLTPPEWHARDAPMVAELKTIGTVQPFEKEYFRKDGSRVPVLIGVTAFHEKRDQGVGFVLDLTERKRAERALRDSEELKRKIIESSTDCIEVLDLDGNLLFMSSSGQHLLEIDDIGPYLNSCWVDFWRPQDRSRVSEAIAAARAGGIGKFQAFCPSAKGVPRWWDVITTPICNADGEPEQLLLVSRDITERKRAEAQALEGEQRYRDVQMELAHANRVATMGQLTASIAHEVKQPIASSVNNAESALNWLNRPAPNLDEAREAIACVVDDGHRAAEVIDRIRDLVRKAPPLQDRLEINRAIRQVIELTRGEAVKNRVSVDTQLAEELPPIAGDRVQLQQVILNLIINAIQAMSATTDGPRRLVISTGKAESGGVLVAVRDSGFGLAPGNLEHIFEAFHTTKPGGFGLGLSICRSIIDAHSGRLWASANEPRGAIFQFTLPAYLDSAS
ncbi:PAS domain S-box-containing protein [Nitrobacteraceae bacterium AZCC 2161]